MRPLQVTARSRRRLGLLLFARLLPILVFAPARPVAGLDPERRTDQYVFEYYEKANGLPESHIQAMMQSRDGYLWIGSQAGLTRFDGVVAQTFSAVDTPAFSTSDDVRSVVETLDGVVWAATVGGGLIRYRDGSFEALGADAGLPSLRLRALAATSDGLWIGTLDAGIARLVEDRVVERWSTANGLPDDEVWALVTAPAGDLWIGMQRGGLSRLRAGRLESWSTANGLAGDLVQDLLLDRQGRLWVATDRGVQCLEGDRWTSYGLSDGLPSLAVQALAEDRDGNLWAGTAGGAARLAYGRFSPLSVAEGLPHEHVWSMFEDAEGNFWVGTEDGLSRLHDGMFVVWGKKQGLSTDLVRGIRQSRDGSLLIGTEHGVDRLEAGRLTSLSARLGLPMGRVFSILETSDRALWVSSEGTGATRVRDGSQVNYGPESGLGSKHVWSLVEGATPGEVWAGTHGAGLAHFSDGQWTRFTHEHDGLGADVVRTVLVDRHGDVWAGTDAGGLSRVHEGFITTYTSLDGLSSDTVRALFEDPEGNLWIGLHGGGLTVRVGETFRVVPQDTFAVNLVGSMVEDDLGFLWTTTDRGMRRTRTLELLEAALGERDRVDILEIGAPRGLRGDFPAGFTPASWKARDGRLWFATSRGAASVDPSRVDINRVPPPVRVETMQANHQVVDLRRAPELPPETFDVEFHYSAPFFQAASRVRFRYRIEGLDQDWVEAGDRRVAYYTNLPPGPHRFRVTACNQDGVWNPIGATLEFRVLPRFYQTWWFRVLVAAVALLLLYGLYRLRTGRLEARAAVAEERNRLAREIHDTIAQDLASILIQSRVAARRVATDPETVREDLERITALAAGSLAEARSSLLTLRSAALEGKDLASALAHTARLLAPDNGPQIEVRATGSEALTPTVEVELLRIGKEAMTNAIRHGDARHIEVELALAAGEATLRVADDGRGFDPETAASSGGFGLLGMRERAQALGGTLAILSTPGSGTAIEAWVPAAGGMP